METVKKAILFAVLAVIVLLAAVVIFIELFGSEIPRPVWAPQALSGPLLQARRWQSIGQVPLISQTVDVGTVEGWYVKPMPITSGTGYRFTLRGRFASSEPLFFVVIEPAQVRVMQQGYPPIVQYSARETEPISTAWPSDGSFYGFVRPAPQVSAFPTSITEIALLLLRHNLEEHRPPARVSVELTVAGECFCTDAEAAAQAVK
jgi:hypothetical protein